MSTDAHNDPGQPLVAHLTELRDRLLRIVLAILVCAIALMPFSAATPGSLSASPASSVLNATRTGAAPLLAAPSRRRCDDP